MAQAFLVRVFPSQEILSQRILLLYRSTVLPVRNLAEAVHIVLSPFASNLATDSMHPVQFSSQMNILIFHQMSGAELFL